MKDSYFPGLASEGPERFIIRMVGAEGRDKTFKTSLGLEKIDETRIQGACSTARVYCPLDMVQVLNSWCVGLLLISTSKVK